MGITNHSLAFITFNIKTPKGNINEKYGAKIQEQPIKTKTDQKILIIHKHKQKEINFYPKLVN